MTQIIACISLTYLNIYRTPCMCIFILMKLHCGKFLFSTELKMQIVVKFVPPPTQLWFNVMPGDQDLNKLESTLSGKAAI